MSIQLIDLSDDLRKLREEGFNVAIVESNLIIKGIPYVNKEKKILFGTIFCPLKISGDRTAPPDDHTVYFVGEHPCDQFGNENHTFVNSQRTQVLTTSIVGNFYFSSKPQNGNYPDFFKKMTRYIELLSAPAQSIDSSVSAKKFEYEAYQDASVFVFPDTNAARAGVSNITAKIKNQKIAIIGLGGTGSYVLDFVCKTPVKQISLFDGDEIFNHNAFRMPGIVTLDALKRKPSKVKHFEEMYSQFRTGIVGYDVFLDESNVDLLDGHDFVFIAIDRAEAKKSIIDYLIASKIPFVDLGMGLSIVGDSIRGSIRRTLITPANNSCINKIAVSRAADEDIYSQNIQISELNALNAIMGVIAWKKLNGFYLSSDDIVYNSVFIIDEEEINNET